MFAVRGKDAVKARLFNHGGGMSAARRRTKACGAIVMWRCPDRRGRRRRQRTWPAGVSDSYEPFLRFMVKVMSQALGDVVVYRKCYAALQELAPSALTVLAAFKEQPETRLQRKTLIERTGLPRATVTVALRALHERGFVQRQGRGAAVSYQLAFLAATRRASFRLCKALHWPGNATPTSSFTTCRSMMGSVGSTIATVHVSRAGP